MRTEQQIKRKINELVMQKKSLEERLASSGQSEGIQVRIDQTEQMIMLLEWVLNEPTGGYHM